MADVYEMPTPKPPTDVELDKLDETAGLWQASLEIPALARQVIRVQRTAIRNLRIELAKAQARTESVQAVAAMRRDAQVADDVETTESCPGSGTPPEEFEYLDEDLIEAGKSGTKATPTGGRCSVCHNFWPLERSGALVVHEKAGVARTGVPSGDHD